MHLRLKKTENTPNIMKEFGKRDIMCQYEDMLDELQIDLKEKDMNGYIAYASFIGGYIRIHQLVGNDSFEIPFEEVKYLFCL